MPKNFSTKSLSKQVRNSEPRVNGRRLNATEILTDLFKNCPAPIVNSDPPDEYNPYTDSDIHKETSWHNSFGFNPRRPVNVLVHAVYNLSYKKLMTSKSDEGLGRKNEEKGQIVFSDLDTARKMAKLLLEHNFSCEITQQNISDSDNKDLNGRLVEIGKLWEGDESGRMYSIEKTVDFMSSAKISTGFIYHMLQNGKCLACTYASPDKAKEERHRFSSIEIKQVIQNSSEEQLVGREVNFKTVATLPVKVESEEDLKRVVKQVVDTHTS